MVCCSCAQRPAPLQRTVRPVLSRLASALDARRPGARGPLSTNAGCPTPSSSACGRSYTSCSSHQRPGISAQVLAREPQSLLQEPLMLEDEGSSEIATSSSNSRQQALSPLSSLPSVNWTSVAQAAAYMLPVTLAYLAREPLQSCWDSYCFVLEQQPLLTKIATGAICGVLGDLAAQVLSHDGACKLASAAGLPQQPFQYDAARTAKLCLFGIVLGTPYGHFWYQFLDQAIMPHDMTNPIAVVSKMVLDQFFSTPLMTAAFFMYTRCVEGRPEDAWAYACTKLKPTLIANYALWPLAHIINFAFVPPAQRILYCNVVGLFWTVIFSTIANSPTPPSPAKAQAVARDQ